MIVLTSISVPAGNGSRGPADEVSVNGPALKRGFGRVRGGAKRERFGQSVLQRLGECRMTFEEFMGEYERERMAQFIDKVWLKPAGRVGSRVPPVEERVEVYFVGSDQPTTIRPPLGDPETLKILRAAHS